MKTTRATTRVRLQAPIVDRCPAARELGPTAPADTQRAQTGARRYEVLAITAGNGNGLEYPPHVLQQAVPLFAGASVFLDHAQMNELWGQSGNRSLSALLGVLEDVRWAPAGDGISASLRVLPGPHEGWFCALVDEYLADLDAGRPAPAVGLSAVLDVTARDGRVERIDEVVSVDAVFDPARGGRFVRALNARETQSRRKENNVQRTESDGKPVVDAGSFCNAGGTAGGDPAVGPGVQGVPPASLANVQSMLSEVHLEQRLAQSALPAPLQQHLRQRFAGQATPPAREQVDREIEALQAAWACSVAQAGGVVKGVGAARGSGWQVGMNEGERLQAAVDRLCGLRPASEALGAVPRLSGIRELYLACTGDHEFHGVFHPDRVALANVTTTTLTSLVKNAFNKVILDYFDSVDLWWKPVVSEEEFSSLKDATLVTVGGFGDLPTVTEGAAYAELEWSDSEEVVSFVKKGGYVGITLEMMDRDETRAFRAIPRKIATAGYRTLSTLVSELFTANSGVGPYWPSSQTTYRLFDTQHGNLGSTALSLSSWDECIQAMYSQTEATSGKPMGIRPAYLLVPIELEKTALTILQSELIPGSANNDANVRRGSARVVTVPDWTDASDWAAVADPRIYPGIVVGYRYGSTPEVFVAGEETVGSMFTNDEMRIKARFVVAVGVGDYRPLFKANVA